MGNLAPSHNSRFIQGRFVPRNSEKYIGDSSKIFLRSSWEFRFSKWCDSNPSIIAWTSETTVIPYQSPIDNKMHQYYVDFSIFVKTKSGPKKFYVEIKPFSQTQKPVVSKRKKMSTILEEEKTFIINSAKWAAARIYAKNMGGEFIVITEKELGLDK